MLAYVSWSVRVSLFQISIAKSRDQGTMEKCSGEKKLISPMHRKEVVKIVVFTGD